jgi:hypothetical protein
MVAVEPWISNEIPDLSERSRPVGHVHILRVERAISAFRLVGQTPGEAGLRCHGLHRALEDWMTRYQGRIERRRPRAVPLRTVAVDAWKAEHKRLDRVLERSDTALQSARQALHEANTAASTAAAIAAAAVPPPQPPSTPAPGSPRARHWLRWLPPRAPKVDPILAGLPPRPTTRQLAALERAAILEQRAANARAHVTERRNQLAQAQISHEAAQSAIAAHAARRALAEAQDLERQAEAARAATEALEKWRTAELERVRTALRGLPNGTFSEVHRRGCLSAETRGGRRNAWLASS